MMMLNDLSLMPYEANVPSQEYLWSLIELCANHSYYELCEAFLHVWHYECSSDETIDERQKIKNERQKIGNFLMNCIETTQNCKEQWYIYGIMNQFGLEHLINEKELQIKLILSNEFDLDDKQINEVIELLNSTISNCDEKSLTIIRNLVLNKPKMAQIVIDLFDDSNSLNHVYVQCLIHSIKNSNINLMIEILKVFPDEEINDKNLQLLQEVCDQFSYEDETEVYKLYSNVILRKNSKLLQTLINIRRNKKKNPLFDVESKQFNFKECFLLAACEKKHFVFELLEDDEILYHLPTNIRLFFIIYALYKNDLKLDKFLKIESELKFLVFYCEEMNLLEKSDYFISGLIKKLKFIFKMTDWCATHSSSSINKSHLKFNIFQSLMRGELPLKILKKYSFLENNSEFNFNINEELCDLLSSYSECELMIYRGFLAVRLSIMWIIMEDQNEEEEIFSQKILFLLNNILPYAFRVEVMENIFSLLFITQNEMTENENDDDDYTELSDASDRFTTGNSSGRFSSISFSRSSNFLCPNSVVSPYLNVLKEAAIEAQTKLFILKSYGDTGNYVDSPHLNVPTSIKSLEECKRRLETLITYINEAQWRFSVIQPAFAKNTERRSLNSTSDLEDDSESKYQREQNTQRRLLISCGSTSGSEFQNKNEKSKEIFSSVISCMLASPNQLLRYSLLQGQFTSAHQVIKIFEKQLKKSEEMVELNIIEKWNELIKKLNSLSNSSKESNKSKISEAAASGYKVTLIQSHIHEFMLDLKCDDQRKHFIALDFTLTASPNLEISKMILETIFPSQKSIDLPEKVNLLIHFVSKMLSEIPDENHLKSISFSNLLTHLYEKNKLFDAKIYKNEKLMEYQLSLSFEELNEQLVKLDPKKLADETDSTTELEQKTSLLVDAKRVNILYDKLLRVCPAGKFNYMKSLFYYVRKVSKALAECKKRSKTTSRSFNTSYNDTSYFAILQQSPSAILCSMILKDRISPKFVDDLAKEMKVDLASTLCSVLCPSIPSNYLKGCPVEFQLNDSCYPALCELIETHLSFEKITECRPNQLLYQISNHFDDEEDESSTAIDEKINNPDLIEYFKSKSPILVEVMKLLKLIKGDQTHFFKSNSPLIKWLELVKKRIRANWLEETAILALAMHPRIYISHNTVMKILEFHAIRGSLSFIHELLKFIDIDVDEQPLNESTSCYSLFRKQNSSFKTLCTAILAKLAIEEQDVKYAFQIKGDCECKCEIILNLVETAETFKNADEAIKALKSCLASISSENIDLTNKIKIKIFEIEFYSKIGQLAGLRCWKDAKDNLNPIDILTIIKSKRKYQLAQEWFSIHNWDEETIDLQSELLINLYCVEADLAKLEEFLESIYNKSIDLISIILKIISNIENLEGKHFLVKFLLQKYSFKLPERQIIYYNNYLRGLKLVQLLEEKNQKNYLNLVANPILIIEQMIMNIEYEALESAAKQSQLPIIDGLIEKYAQKAVEVVIYDDFQPVPHGSVISDATLISSSILDPPFQMPASVPTRDQWVPDSSVIYCMSCKIERFSMLNRKHHCRRCGRIVCGNCSQNTLKISEINPNEFVRVCDDCYIQTQQLKRKASQVSLSEVSSVSSQNKKKVWILNCDETQNETIRNEFYYESAPSVSLCLALLKFHSDKKRCCNVIINLICKPLLETIASKQVDYGLVIGMIRSLLISTKISIDDENHLELIESLNFLLGRLEAIRMLINANCNTKEMISYALSNAENSIIKLQEKLLEMERFELARDIAMKCGLDLKPIWKSWALLYLRHGQFGEAREKFRHCMKLYKTKEKSTTLEEILICLENQKKVVSLSLRNQCLQIKNGKYNFYNPKDYHNFENPNFKMSSQVYNEVLYYLDQYGTKEDTIKFYAKHNLWKQAIEAIINENNLANVFTKEVFMTAAKRGALNQLFNAIRSIDPTFTRIWKFLIAACKFLSRSSLFNVLYVLQLFMNDYLRAAITQVNCFYLNPPASDYIELHNRIEHLLLAKQHCRQYLSLEKNEHHSGCLFMEKSDVMRQIYSIELQIEISNNFFNKNIKEFSPLEVVSEDSDPEKQLILPNLLDHSKARKIELAALVTICYGSSISEGFNFAQKIIKLYNLDSAQIYRLAGRALIQSENNGVIKSIEELLNCIYKSTDEDTSTLCDDVVTACIRSCKTPELIEPLIQLLSSSINKIDAYILNGKLKLAYLLAISLNRSADVTRVLEAATRTEQTQIKNICERWLSQKRKSSIN